MDGDDLPDRIATVLLADPWMARLLAAALDLADGDPDRAAALVWRRLRQEHPADAGARTVLKRGVALAVRSAATRSRRLAAEAVAQGRVAVRASEWTRLEARFLRRDADAALAALRRARARVIALAPG